jgi:glutathione S-transferase
VNIVYGAYGSPYVRKVLVFHAEKKIPYQMEPTIPISVGPEYRKIHPMGKIPALRDGDLILPDSSVICAYLEKKQPMPALYPSDPYEYGRALWFEEYGDTALMQVIGGKIFFPKILAPLFLQKPVDEEAIQKAVREDLPPLHDYLESQLREGKPLVGEAFSIADIGIASPFVNLKLAGFGVDAQRWPKLASYVERIHSRPSFQEILEKERHTFKVN